MNEMVEYKVTLTDGSKFVMGITRNGGPEGAVFVNFHDPKRKEDWQGTGFNFSDSSCCLIRMAELLAEKYAVGGYGDDDDDDDCVDIESVE